MIRLVGECKYSKLTVLFLIASSLYGKPVRFEAEHLFARDVCNRIIEDRTASNGSCRVAYVDYDSKGHMQYGPNITFFPGYYIATFRLKLGNTHTGINPVCVLDITSRRVYPLKYHALRKINASYFESSSKWQDFRVGFYLRDTVDCFQLRIEWLDSADLYVDYVDIAPNPDTENTVYAVNLQDLNLDLSIDTFDFRMADRRILLASIQGAVNRARPRLVLLHNDGDYEGQGIHRWLHSFDIPYTLVNYEECIEKLAKQKYFKGCILFDPGEPDSRAIKDPPERQKLLFQMRAIATNLAALESLLIVTPRTIKDINTALFPIKYDLTNRGLFPFLRDSTGRQALDFNLRLLRNRNFRKDIAFKLFPYMSMSPLRNAAEKLTDYAIRNRHWCFYTDLRDASDNSFLESGTMRSIRYLMGYCDEGLKDSIEYYCKEYEHIRLGSEAGKLWIGDMNRIHNLSFFAGFEADSYYHQSVPSIPPLENKIYISFLSMDGDNPILQLKHYRKDWDSPLRGSIPVSWGFPPKLCDLAPAILQYYYNTRTPNDCLIADVSGLAWHLTNHFDFNDFPDMLDVMAEYFGKLNIKVVKLMADRNDDLVDVGYLQRFVKAYPQLGGFIEGYWPPKEGGFMMVNEEYPSIRLAINKPIASFGDKPSVYTVVEGIRDLVVSNSERPLFIPVVYNIYNPAYTIYTTIFDKLDSIVDILDNLYGSRVVYTREDVMMELVKSYYRASDAGNTILLNGGFEKGPEGWHIDGNVRVDENTPHEGMFSALVNANASLWQGIDVIGGKEYRLKAWFRPEISSTGIFRVVWYSTEPIAVDTIVCYNAKTATVGWLFYFRDIKAPTGTNSARIYFEAKSNAVRFDDVDFKEVVY